MRLKICHIIPTLVQGGAEKQMALLASHLDRERFESHVLVLTHSGPLEQSLRQQGVPVHLIGKRGKFDPTALWRLTAKLKQLAPDVVHSWLFAGNSYGRWAARRAAVPAIVAGERCVDPWKQWWHYAIDKWLLRRTDTIVTNTAAVAQFYARQGIAESHFTVIPNAVLPPDSPPLSREEFFQRLSLPARGKVIGAVGRLWKQKGYRDLVWAAELIRVAYQDVCLVVVGDGPDRESLLAYRDRASMHSTIHFVGHRQDAGQLLSSFDVLWNGSLYEGQSNTILEAMARGVPVVASDIPGNRDLVVDGQTGFLFGLGDVATLTR
ncbi:MAG: glycosyltransferase, partial [Planctomycetales bacterium]|nr:glycosyltransferase [Planctomycetales bacterium]